MVCNGIPTSQRDMVGVLFGWWRIRVIQEAREEGMVVVSPKLFFPHYYYDFFFCLCLKTGAREHSRSRPAGSENPGFSLSIKYGWNTRDSFTFT